MIGREDQCELVFSSRTVSRKHCAIIFNDSDVLIKDLGSRNGTVVDHELISRDLPKQLAHHSQLRIGKYTFRVSIRDAETNRPHRPELIDLSTLSGPLVVPGDKAKGAAQLLSELDELAAKLDMKESGNESIGNHDDESQQTSSTVLQQSETRELKSVDEAVGAKVAAEPSTDICDSTPIETEAEAKRIPKHLRPKGPKDSQSAAATALRNLFTK